MAVASWLDQQNQYVEPVPSKLGVKTGTNVKVPAKPLRKVYMYSAHLSCLFDLVLDMKLTCDTKEYIRLYIYIYYGISRYLIYTVHIYIYKTYRDTYYGVSGEYPSGRLCRACAEGGTCGGGAGSADLVGGCAESCGVVRACAGSLACSASCNIDLSKPCSG